MQKTRPAARWAGRLAVSVAASLLSAVSLAAVQPGAAVARSAPSAAPAEADGSRQLLSARSGAPEAAAAKRLAPASFQGQGDGTYALFYKGNVYNLPHHRFPRAGQELISCYPEETPAALCTGWPRQAVTFSPFPAVFGAGPLSAGATGDVYSTSEQPGEYVSASGRLYFPAVLGSLAGVGCIDLATVQSCGLFELTEDAEAVSWQSNARVRVNGQVRMYISDSKGRIFCFNTATEASCGAPFPVELDAAGVPSRSRTPNLWSMEAFCDRPARPEYVCDVDAAHNAYIFTTMQLNPSPPTPAGFPQALDLLCFNVLTSASCGSGFPSRVSAQTGQVLFSRFIAPTLDRQGGVTGACVHVLGLEAGNVRLTAPSPPYGWNCRSLTGAAVPSQLPLPQDMAGSPEFLILGYNGFGSPGRVGTRLYFPTSASSNQFPPNASDRQSIYTCVDFASRQPGQVAPACQGFTNVGPTPTAAYSFREHPGNLGCLWEEGDNGIIQNFSAFAGGSLGCPAGGSLKIVKKAEEKYFSKAGSKLHYYFTVTSTGTTTVSGIKVGDSRAAQVTCPRTFVDPGTSMTCKATYVTTPADVKACKVTNTATVTGTGGQAAVTATSNKVTVPARHCPKPHKPHKPCTCSGHHKPAHSSGNARNQRA
ncbi:hypothetical protein [Streptomyces sp. NPDC096030]|uniref:DUF7507 domain-containing protein n=1 Tax=Streptomyces sp. NPDC096030 TaxID=3155423 RepID=UPI003327FAA3